MTVSPPISPVCYQVLADRHGAPGALLLAGAAVAVGDGGAGLPLALLTELASLFPCFYGADLEEAAAAPLQQAGWKRLDPASVARADTAPDAPLAPELSWIAGNWYMQAPPRPAGQQAASRALALQLVQLVSADADTHDIEALLRRDPNLSYQLLRLVNALGSGTGRRVSSFSQALMILGRQQLRRWLNLMLFSAREGDTRSAMLLARVAVRACALELLARAAGLDKQHQEQAFMVGMFSLLGVLFGMPLPEVLAPLTLSEAVQAALLEHGGPLGALLALVETAEHGDCAALAAQLPALQIDAAAFNLAYAEAQLWMLGVATGAQSPAHA